VKFWFARVEEYWPIKAKGEFARELVIPFGADDVLSKMPGPFERLRSRERRYCCQWSACRWPSVKKDLSVAGLGEVGRLRNGKDGCIEIGIRAPADFSIRGDALGKTVLKKNP